MATIHDKLTAIGDAIRTKTGGTELLTLDEMATQINNFSGSGGTLTVVAEAGASVTVSNSSKSYTKVVGADGNVVFQGLEDGTWTITGISNSVTATETVNIDTSYSSQMKFVTYLYNDGTMHSPLSSGFSGRGTVTNNNNMIKFSTSYNTNTLNYTTWSITTDSIDLTNYNWLYVDFSEVGQANVYVGFQDVSRSSTDSTIDACICVSNESDVVYKMSLDGINAGSYRFGIACEGMNDGDGCSINNVWLSASDAYDATTVTPVTFTATSG